MSRSEIPPHCSPALKRAGCTKKVNQDNKWFLYEVVPVDTEVERLMKHESSRTEQIVTLREDNPCSTGASIARAVGVSRERVRQVLSKRGLENSRVTPKKMCLNCGKILPYRRTRYCTWGCHKEHHRIPIECPVCGKIFHLVPSQVLYRLHRSKTGNLYCSRYCWSVKQTI